MKTKLTVLAVALVAIATLSLNFSDSAFAAGLSRTERAKQEAEFINNFLSFVDWPAKSYYDNKAPAVVCVLGKSPFGNALARYASGKEGPRAMTLLEIESLSQIPACHMLFINTEDTARMGEILGSFGDSAVLTMSEIEGFADKGGMIEFSDDGRGVRLKVNQKTAQDAGFKISSKLLRVATIVGQ